MTTTDTTTLTRRGLLAAGGALCATCAAGCATYGTPTGSAPSQAPAAPAPQAAPQPAPGAQAGIAAVADIPVGGGKIFADQSVVVTQPQAGTFAAFDTTCPHQGCQVTEVTDGSISCPCHGSRFAVTDGAPTEGPATSPLGTRNVTVQGDRIVLA